MANNFKAYTTTGVTDETTVFTGPDNTQTTIIGMSIANVSGNDSKVDVKLDGAYIIKQASLVSGQSLVVIGGDQKVVCMAGKDVKVASDNSVDVIVSTLEIS